MAVRRECTLAGSSFYEGHPEYLILYSVHTVADSLADAVTRGFPGICKIIYFGEQ